MKKLLCLPAALAIATLSAHAQETPGGILETDTQSQTENTSTRTPGTTGGTADELDAAAAPARAGATHLAQDFSEVDKDGDQELSIEEAREAFPPELVVIDTNNDGKLNQSEVESLVPGLLFNEDGSPAEEGATVGEEEYERIVQNLQESGERQATASRAAEQDEEV